MSFRLNLFSFVSVPSLLKKEINAFDSFSIERLAVTVLSMDDSYGDTLMILTKKEFCVDSLDFIKGGFIFQFIVQLFLINSLKPLKI